MAAVNAKTKARRWPWKWVALAAVVAALVAAARMLPLQDWLAQFNDWVSGIGPLGVLVFAGFYAVAAVLFVPGSVLTIGAGVIFGLLWGTVAVSIGSTLAAAAAFLIARYVAREKVSQWAKSNPKFNAIDRAIGRQGWQIVALLRLSPLVPFSLGNYLYGLTAVRFWPYLLASWAAMLPATVLYVYLGVVGKAGIEAAAGRGAERSPLETVFLIVGLIATGVATWFVTRIARKALREAALEQEGD